MTIRLIYVHLLEPLYLCQMPTRGNLGPNLDFHVICNISFVLYYKIFRQDLCRCNDTTALVVFVFTFCLFCFCVCISFVLFLCLLCLFFVLSFQFVFAHCSCFLFCFVLLKLFFCALIVKFCLFHFVLFSFVLHDQSILIG